MTDPLNESDLVSKALEDGLDLRAYLTKINDRLGQVAFRTSQFFFSFYYFLSFI